MEESEKEELNRLRKYYRERMEEDIKMLKMCTQMLAKTMSVNQKLIDKNRKEIEKIKKKLSGIEEGDKVMFG